MAPSATGNTFSNSLSDKRELENSLLGAGAGVAAGDVDGDGWCDLFFCGIESPSVLYRNLGDWKFQEITAEAGVACPGQNSTGAVFADVEGDGDLDLLVTALGGGTRLFLNDGKGCFTEKTASGLVRKFGSTSMALADIDGNGTLDLYVANYATTKIEDRPNARFESKVVNGEILLTAIDGVPTSSPELTNRYFVDAERVVREWGEPDLLYRNDGEGEFRPLSWTDGTFLDEQGKSLRLPPYDFGLSVMFRDLDGDRDPDIYVCNDLFPPDRIWVNDGAGRFRALSALAVRNTCRFSMGIDFADINRDGADDFFVVDMLSRDHLNRKVQTSGVDPIFLPIGKIDNRPQYKRNTLYLGRGDGTYAEIAQLSGLEATEWSWMPLFLDVDLDGFEDVLVSTGHVRDSLNADSVGTILRLRTRKLSDAEHRALKKRVFPILTTSNQAFRNRGDLTFEDKAHEWGFDYRGISQAMCLADLDNDGDLDVIVVHLNDAVGLYRNESVAPRVAVRLKGKAPNTRGIGAKIRLLGGAVPDQSQEMICGGRYLSCDDTVRMFAAGNATNGMSIEVTWRNGTVSLVKEVQFNRLYEIEEPNERPKLKAQPVLRSDGPEGGRSNAVPGQVGLQLDRRGATAEGGSSKEDPRSNAQDPRPGHQPSTINHQPFFVDVSHLLNHTHVDDGFDDFERQPLLGRKFSQLGPGVAWFDLNGDGREELIVGSGKGGQLAIFSNDPQKSFVALARDGAVTAPRDLTTVIGWMRAPGKAELLVGASNYEDGSTNGESILRFGYAESGLKSFPGLPACAASVGALSLADIDGDGDLDLFAGGRVKPGRYPETASSRLFRNAEGAFELDRENCSVLENAGLVTGACFTDLNGDGWPELVLAGEWGPVRMFRNERGKLVLWDAPVSINHQPTTINQLSGWWNAVAAGDFDGDGRMDIVASNWGRNTKYQNHRRQPLRIVYGDWKNNGTVDALEAYYDESMKKWVPWCSFAVAQSMPWAIEQFPTHRSFGAAGIGEILGERLNAAKTLEANWLETCLFLNRGERFEVRPLPVESQFAPAFGISIADLDGDGNEDIFLSQNFFAVDGDTSRYDAGRGLWLAGDGKGNFRSVGGQVSGITVYGEQRGCAVCDYDGDGRVDLVVTQNGALTRLYHNDGAKPGLRVRLIGPPGNPNGIGATLRAVMDGRSGPAREIHVGSGYWSQDSVVQVMATPEPPTQLDVRWPGGKTVRSNLPKNACEIAVDSSGQVKVVR